MDADQILSRVKPVGRPLHVALGALWQETNAFNPRPTDLEDFRIERDAGGLAATRGTGTVLGGMISVLEHAGARLYFALSARARPGGAISDAAVESLVSELCDDLAAARPDAVCLELHGAMVGDKVDDVEGMLLARLRGRLGPDVPIVVGLDLHGHVTARMVEAVDFLTGYRTQPHRDMFETGRRAAAVLLEIVEEGLRPCAFRQSLPFLALARDETDEAPMASVLEQLARHPLRAGASYLDASIFNVHPFLDVPSMGQVVVCYARDTETAAAVGRDVASALETVRAQFIENRPAIDELPELVERSKAAGSILVVGDEGDSVLAGTPGDSVAVASFLLHHAAGIRALVPVYAPDCFALARARGPGEVMTASIGGNVSPGLSPLMIEARVAGLPEGTFKNSGLYMKGNVNDLGRCALLRAGEVYFLATSREPSAVDPALVAFAGLSLDRIDLLVVKSSNHYRLSFGGGFDCVTLATPGLSCRDPSLLAHKRARPIFPIDRDVPTFLPVAQVSQSAGHTAAETKDG